MKNRKFKRYEKIAHKIIALAETYQQMSDEELQTQTANFREQLEQGTKLENLLIPAYAVVVETDRRILGMKPYFVQILGAIALFFGNVAEMKTGEGKTLTATMPLYLHGLKGKGNFLITSNPYLARRDAKEMSKVYEFLGLSVEIGVPEFEDEEIDKEVVYAADIVYTTNSALGFDYLFDNLAVIVEKQFINQLNYVLIDEIDAILLDMAQTPLVISGAPKVQSNFYALANWFVKGIAEDEDYQLSENQKSVWFTEMGIQKAEAYFGVQHILSEEWRDLYRHLVIALRANYILHINRDYVVDDGEIVLLDETNGRKLAGTKLQAGLHQALEAKENVVITKETRSMGSITYQNLFRKFSVISGMTGTALTDADEFRETYNLDVITVPTNKPINRVDHPDLVFLTNRAKIMASLEAVKGALLVDRPILIEAGSVSMSTLYSLILLQNGIPHNLLNATTASRESWIISEAGKHGAVTVATSMAGRGTDIKLDSRSKKQGGLFVIGTERMTSDRIDNQLRGRSGRQGDPGDSVFYVSLEDRIVVESAPKWANRKRQEMLEELDKGKLAENVSLSERKYRKVIDKSQAIRKNQEVAARRNTLEFDEIITIQRDTIYKTRNMIMTALLEELDQLIHYSFNQAIDHYCNDTTNLNSEALTDFIFNTIDYDFDPRRVIELGELTKKNVKEFLVELIRERLAVAMRPLANLYQQIYFKRLILLKALDQQWIEQSDNLQQLKVVVNGRNWGQHRPIYEFQIEAKRSFEQMKKEVSIQILKNMLLSELVPDEDGSIDVEFP